MKKFEFFAGIIATMVFFLLMGAILFPQGPTYNINLSKWMVNDTTNVGIDTTAVFMNEKGTGQINVNNIDKNDTLKISFNDGESWDIIPPGITKNWEPCNYDTLHYPVLGDSNGDSSAIPILSWTIYDVIH